MRCGRDENVTVGSSLFFIFFSSLHNEGKYQGLNKIMHVKHLTQGPEHNKLSLKVSESGALAQSRNETALRQLNVGNVASYVCAFSFILFL